MRKITRIAAGLLALTLAFAIAAPAATVDVSAVRKVTAKSDNYKKAAKVKKGVTKVTVANSSNPYIKFTAPKTKTYTLTFYKVNAVRKADRKRNSVNGYLSIGKLSGYYSKYVSTQEVKTNYGKATSLQLCSRTFYKSWYRSSYNSKKKPDSYLLKRFAKVKINKGETIYISGYFAGVTNSKASYFVKIK